MTRSKAFTLAGAVLLAAVMLVIILGVYALFQPHVRSSSTGSGIAPILPAIVVLLLMRRRND